MYVYIEDNLPHNQQIARGLFIANAFNKAVQLIHKRSTFQIEPGSSLKENLDRWKQDNQEQEAAEVIDIPEFEDIRYSIIYAVLAGNKTQESIWITLNRKPIPQIIAICVANGWLSFDDETEILGVTMNGLVFLEDYFDWEYFTKRRHPDDYDQLLQEEYRKRFAAGEKVPPSNEYNMTGKQDLLDAMARDRRVWLVFHQYPHLFGFKGKGKLVMRNIQQRHDEWRKLLLLEGAPTKKKFKKEDR